MSICILFLVCTELSLVFNLASIGSAFVYDVLWTVFQNIGRHNLLMYAGVRVPVSQKLRMFVLLQVESEFVPLYNTYGIGLTTWSPLASGVLTGKYSKGNIPAESRFALDNYKVTMETLSLYYTHIFLLFLLTAYRIAVLPP